MAREEEETHPLHSFPHFPKHPSSKRSSPSLEDALPPRKASDLPPEPILTMRSLSLLVISSIFLTWSLVLLGTSSHPGVQQVAKGDALNAAATSSSSSSYHGSGSKAPVSAYTAPAAFPTSAFSSYYTLPSSYEAEPRPAVTKYGSGGYYPDDLDQPYPLPTGPPSADAVYPKQRGKPPAANYTAQIKSNITSLINDTSQPACQRCIGALQLGQKLARANPKAVPGVLIDLCTEYKYASTKSGLNQTEACKRTYSGAILGAQYAQILSYADLNGTDPSDGQYICSYVVGSKSGCKTPAPIDLNADGFLDRWFGGKQKRDAIRIRASRNERRALNVGPAHLDTRGNKKPMRVLHFSDIHVDPRFFVGAEAACTSGQCCRSDSFNSTVASGPPSPPGAKLAASNLSESAVYWGNYRCDSPWSLAVAAMRSVSALNSGDAVDMTLYTGDMVTHDSAWHLSNDLVSYTQQAIFDTMKRYLGKGPVFSAIGNHDTAPSDSASQHSLPDAGPRNEFSYDWDNLKRLFEAEGWFTHDEAKQVSRHYGGYSVSPRKGLRIITLNTDFWYKANTYNFIGTKNPDQAGILRFLTDELEGAERRNERVWIVGHVLTGWDGSNPLANPTNLFYQIVDHYSPKTIAHIFFGHTHEDQFSVFYSNNGTQRITANAKAVSFMSPSITPGTNVNSALRFYTIDPETYEILDYDQYYTQVAGFPQLPESGHGPVWEHLYSARQAYGNFTSSAVDGHVGNGTVRLSSDNTWPSHAPLNATFWSALTDEMEKRPDLVTTFHRYQGRNSPKTPACNQTCINANICYMRSGSSILGQECPQGFGSVQGG